MANCFSHGTNFDPKKIKKKNIKIKIPNFNVMQF